MYQIRIENDNVTLGASQVCDHIRKVHVERINVSVTCRYHPETLFHLLQIHKNRIRRMFLPHIEKIAGIVTVTCVHTRLLDKPNIVLEFVVGSGGVLNHPF